MHILDSDGYPQTHTDLVMDQLKSESLPQDNPSRIQNGSLKSATQKWHSLLEQPDQEDAFLV
jgi:hypothetical protein